MIQLISAVFPLVLDIDGWGHMGGGWGWGMAVMGLVMMISVIALVVWAIVSSSRRPVEPGRSGDRAQALLDQRYAAGDIDRDEYLERKGDLER